MKKHLLGAALAACLATPAMADIIAYSNNLETNSAGISGAGGRAASAGFGGLGFGNYFWRNAVDPAAATYLTLNLSSYHSNVQLDFDLALIDSWDAGNLTWGPDYFRVKLGATTLFDQTMPPSGPVAGLTVLSSGTNLGFNSGFLDAAYHLTLNLGEMAAGTYTLSFSGAEAKGGGTGWQGNMDESFAIDNLKVTAVPEPGSLALLGFGLAGLGLLRRRRAA